MAHTKISRRGLWDAIGYVPYPAQRLYHASPARFRIPVCGRRFGKSSCAARDLICADPSLPPSHRRADLLTPHSRFWIVGPVYDLGEKEFRYLWDDLLVGQRLIEDSRVSAKYNKRGGDMYIEFPWQSRVEVRSADKDENLVGEGLDGVILSEAAKHQPETWERFIRPALADRRGWASFPTTPEGQNWLHGLWQYGRNPAAEYKDFESWRFPSWMNPHVYPGGEDDPEIKLLRLTTTPEWFAQEIGADFTAFVGRIYAEFQEDIHVTAVPYLPHLPNYISFDWGFTNPLAAVEFQVTPTGQYRVWREHYRSYTTLQDHLKMMEARPQPPGYKIDLCFGDAEDPEAAVFVSTHLAPCIALPEAKTNWRQGIEEVKKLLKLYQTGTDDWDRPIEEPWLKIDFSCQNIIREFNNYRAAERSTKNPMTAKEVARRIDDHALDALRYGAVHLNVLGVNHRLSEVVDVPESYRDTAEGGFFSLNGMRF